MRRALVLWTLVVALTATGIVGVSGYAASYAAPTVSHRHSTVQGERRDAPTKPSASHHTTIMHKVKAAVHRGTPASVHRGTPAVGPCPRPTRDTTNPGCHIVLLHVTITFPPCPPTCKPVVVHTKGNAAYPGGLYAVVLRPKGNNQGIQTGDTVNILINKYGQFAVDAVSPTGTVRKSYVPPVVLVPPSGLPHLQRLTSHGWVTVPHNLVYSPGLFQWHT